LANVAYLVTLPFDVIQHADKNPVGTATMAAVLGEPGIYLMAGAILISTFGCVNGLILAGARVYYAMARDGVFFAPIGTTNSRHVPAVALVAQGVWAAFLALPRTVVADAQTHVPVYGNVYNQLLEYIVSADLAFYTLMVGALVVMRFKAPLAERPYRTPAYPLPPLIYIGLAVLLVLDLVYLAPRTSGMGFLLVLTGIPVYIVWRLAARLRQGTEVPTG
ncbi:MAG TPA: APC family permease, partial [Isosphaeraceae bacterium]|nr:APC family permease [Isosphaeraceae bacterium]